MESDGTVGASASVPARIRHGPDGAAGAGQCGTLRRADHRVAGCAGRPLGPCHDDPGLCNPAEDREDHEILALLELERGRLPDLLPCTREAGLPVLPGRLDGLRLDHAPAHLVHSLVEGRACELGRYLGFLGVAGATGRRIVMCGKAATSRVTPGIIADMLGLPVECMVFVEISAAGAATLARALVEPQTPLAEIVDGMKPRAIRFEPGPGQREAQERSRVYVSSLAGTSD